MGDRECKICTGSDIEGTEAVAVEIVRAVAKAAPESLFGGECSLQAILRLADGTTLRIGVTDDDVGSGRLWVDRFHTGSGYGVICNVCHPERHMK